MASRLENLLQDQLAEARKRAMITARRKLERGLGIEVIILTNGDVKLTITRDNAYPSAAEWDTVCRCFPLPIPKNIATLQEFKASRYTISATFPQQEALQLKFA